MALFKPDPPASGDFFESCILSNSTDIVSSCLMLNCDDLSTEAHRVCKGFHLSSGGCWVKLPSRKAWRTEGLFEQISRKRQPPNLSQAVSFIGQWPAMAYCSARVSQ